MILFKYKKEGYFEYIRKILGTYSSREIKKIQPIVNKVMNLEKEYAKLTDEQLKQKTYEFKKRLETETLDDILPEAFATVRETSWRVLGLKPSDIKSKLIKEE